MNTKNNNHHFTIMHLVKIQAQPGRVYQALATTEGVRNWWTRDVVMGSKIGDEGEFGFYGHQFVIKVKVADLVPASRVCWSVMAAAPGWEKTTITFHLRAEDGGTVLGFAHSGLPQSDETYAGATTRWGYYLTSLQQYLETGKGAPNPDETIGFATPRYGVALEA